MTSETMTFTHKARLYGCPVLMAWSGDEITVAGRWPLCDWYIQ
jgi:hypothetical protein